MGEAGGERGGLTEVAAEPDDAQAGIRPLQAARARNVSSVLPSSMAMIS